MNLDSLIETYYKDAENDVLVNEVLNFLLEGSKAPGEHRRERKLRLPIIVPTEQSVGQAPDSGDRETFSIWMSKLGTESEAGLAGKVRSVQTFINEPQTGSVATTLSYLMFLQTFAWMIKEFNASVAGFLWEPFLAAMFGGKSTQVHTEEGDIADVKLEQSTWFNVEVEPGKLQRVSLKILREAGDVGGSFIDLVNHFEENPGEPMIYVVIRKLPKKQGEDEETDALMQFWQFGLSQETLFDWIGHPKVSIQHQEGFYTHPPEAPPIKWTDLRNALNAGELELDGDEPFSREDWKAQQVKFGEDLLKGSKKQIIGGQTYAVILQSREKMPGAAGPGAKLSPNAKKLWGSDEDYAKWYNRWKELKGDSLFWREVQGPTPRREAKGPGAPGPAWAPNGALGYVKSEQFKIGATYSKRMADELGTIDISDDVLRDTFNQGAQSIGVDLTAMFNALSDLVENVGRFFLLDCGDPEGEAVKCDEEDVEARGVSGRAAVKDADTLQRVVNDKIKAELQSGPTPQFGAAGKKFKKRHSQGTYGGRWEE